LQLLVVSQYFWPENFRVNDLVAGLVQRGHEVTVLTGTPNYPEGRTLPAYRVDPDGFSSYAGAKIVRVPLVARGQTSLRLALNYLSFVVTGLSFGLWRLRGQHFDAIVMVQHSPITSALPALALRRIKHAPLLMWVLDLWPESLAAVGVLRSPRMLNWVGKLVSYIYRRCDLVLVQSRAFFPNIQKYSGDTNRTRYFPGWAEPIFEGALQDVEAASEVAPYSDTFNILFAGNIGEAQDFSAILAAADATRDEAKLRWLIVGDGRAAPWVESEIARLGLQHRVIMLGRHPIERMPSFFRVASALLVSLKKEPIFGMTIPGKVQSYLATGLPILAMLDGEGASVIEQSGAGLACAAGDGLALACQVRALMAMSMDQRAAMGDRGRRYCEQEFSRAGRLSALEGWIAELVQLKN
jgi:glycosyltransferase involved in cell wall biosynthesis